MLADVVRAGLARQQRTQRDLALELGISDKHLSQMLGGRTRGSLDLWDRMLAATWDGKEGGLADAEPPA